MTHGVVALRWEHGASGPDSSHDLMKYKYCILLVIIMNTFRMLWKVVIFIRDNNYLSYVIWNLTICFTKIVLEARPIMRLRLIVKIWFWINFLKLAFFTNKPAYTGNK